MDYESIDNLIDNELGLKRINIIIYPKISGNTYIPNLYANSNNSNEIVNSLGIMIRTFHFRKPDIIHLNWVEYKNIKSLIKLTALFLAVANAKIRGITVMWTPHNIEPHAGKKRLNNFIYNYMGAIADIIITHGEYEKAVFKNTFETKKIVTLKHPPFKLDHEQILKVKLNTTFKSGVRHFIVFGQISPYKEIDRLIFEWKKEWGRLIVAGKWKMKMTIPNKENVTIIDSFLDFNELCALILKCDYSIFNYRKITTSGSLILSKNLGTRVICKSCGNLPEYLDEKDLKFNSFDNLIHLLNGLK